MKLLGEAAGKPLFVKASFLTLYFIVFMAAVLLLLRLQVLRRSTAMFCGSMGVS